MTTPAHHLTAASAAVLHGSPTLPVLLTGLGAMVAHRIAQAVSFRRPLGHL